MTSFAAPAYRPVHLECVSWHLVQHHLGYGALRFEPAVSRHLQNLPPADASLHFCLATLADAPIDVIGAVQYRIAANDLYFDCIHVRPQCRRQGIGRHMLGEVVVHPTCIHIARLHWSISDNDSETLIRHLEYLRDHGRRLCGTPFRLLRERASAINR